MKLDNKISLEQKQTLSLAQLHALKILSLDNFELNQFLQNEYTENPLMEYNVISDLPQWNQYSGGQRIQNPDEFFLTFLTDLSTISKNIFRISLIKKISQSCSGIRCPG